MNLTHWPFEPTPDSPEWDPTLRVDQKEEKVLPGLHTEPEFFGDMVEYADKLVGKVISKLEELELRENTLVIFTSDNGTEEGVPSMLNGEEFIGGKLTSTDAGTHVAMIANWPGVVPEGVVNNDLIGFTYFFPTLAEVASIEIPEDVELDGQSFAPVLFGVNADLRDWLYMWWFRNNEPNGPGDEFARTRLYKLYYDGRFYDLEKDPLEQHSPRAESQLPSEQQEV